MTAERLSCAVPFCGHTTGQWPHASEWICADHWRLVRPLVKRAISRARRQMLKARKNSTARDRLWQLQGRLWQHARRQAIERAVGITA